MKFNDLQLLNKLARILCEILADILLGFIVVFNQCFILILVFCFFLIY